jgi:hypothetical protein
VYIKELKEYYKRIDAESNIGLHHTIEKCCI